MPLGISTPASSILIWPTKKWKSSRANYYSTIMVSTMATPSLCSTAAIGAISTEKTSLRSNSFVLTATASSLSTDTIFRSTTEASNKYIPFTILVERLSLSPWLSTTAATTGLATQDEASSRLLMAGTTWM